MIILDSNVWIALFHEEDALTERAHRIIKQHASRILLPEYVLLETCTVLKNKKHHAAATAFLDRSLNNTDVEFAESSTLLFQKTVELFRNHALADLSFIDVSLLFLSRFYPVITFDKKLANAIKKQAHS